MNDRFFLIWLFVLVPCNIGILFLVTRSFGRRTGWTALVRLYRDPRSRLRRYDYGWQTVFCGKGAFPLCWKHSISIGLDPAGVAMRSTIPFFGDFPPLFVPWEEVEDIQSGETWLGFFAASMTFLNAKATISFRGVAAEAIVAAWNRWNEGLDLPPPLLPPQSDPESW